MTSYHASCTERCAAAVAGALDGGSTSVVPLLERCAFKAVLQVSRFADAKLPPLQLAFTLPLLHFHISPARLQRLMRVINAAVPSACPLPHPCATLALSSDTVQSLYSIDCATGSFACSYIGSRVLELEP